MPCYVYTGLGEDVLQSIQTLNIGQGLQAGTAIVIVAIIIDRITQAFGQGKRARQKTIDAGQTPDWLMMNHKNKK